MTEFAEQLLQISLPIARYRFDWRVKEPICLSEYAGSAIRGAFGRALRRTACMTHLPKCKQCPLYQSCPYSLLFETPSPEHHALQRFSGIPAPYVIEAPDWGRKSYGNGDTLSFSMVLIGRALRQLPLIVFAMQRALGKNLSGGTAELLGVFIEKEGKETIIYRPGDARVADHEPELRLALKDGDGRSVRFVTPLRLQDNGKALGPERVDCARFFSALSRRISLLLELQCAMPLSFPFSDIKKAAEQAELQKSLQWQDWIRYSSRQEQRMHLGGVVGEMTFSNLSDELKLLLEIGAWTHIGKNCSFGLGHFELQ